MRLLRASGDFREAVIEAASRLRIAERQVAEDYWVRRSSAPWSCASTDSSSSREGHGPSDAAAACKGLEMPDHEPVLVVVGTELRNREVVSSAKRDRSSVVLVNASKNNLAGMSRHPVCHEVGQHSV
jgi:hypothetical protein